MRRGVSLFTSFCFIVSLFLPFSGQTVKAEVFNLPQPRQVVPLSKPASLPVLKGLRVNPDNPLSVEFIIDIGDKADVSKEEVQELVNFFLAGLTIPEDNLWVNLSPYEKDRVMPDRLSETELGKQLLCQDYILKQFMSSLTYPETETGKNYWQQTYQEVAKQVGTTNLPVNTFNKVWVVPGKSSIYENGSTVFVVDAKLKTMLEEDFFATKRNGISSQENREVTASEKANQVASKIMKETVLPKVEQDVNLGANFAPLRQVYYSLVLSSWFKEKLKDSLYKHYIDKEKVSGINLSDPQAREKVYNLYLKAFRQGIYNYIRKENDPANGKAINRKYYSGGVVLRASEISDKQSKTFSFPSFLGSLKVEKLRTASVVFGSLSGNSLGRGLSKITFSMGGTKHAWALVNSDGSLEQEGKAIWLKEIPDATADSVTDFLFRKIVAIIEQKGIDNIGLIGISFAGPLDSTTGVVGTPFAAPNQPFDHYNLVSELEKLIQERFGKEITVQIKNDGQAALEGELSEKGGLSEFGNGCIMIVGTGINIAPALDRKLYTGEEKEIGEMGHNLVRTDLLPERYKQYASKVKYTCLSKITKADHPKDNQGNNFYGDLEDNVSGPSLAKKWLKHFVDNHYTTVIQRVLDHINSVLSKQGLEELKSIDEAINIIISSDRNLSQNQKIAKPEIIQAVLEKVTDLAKGGNSVMQELIKKAAQELGWAIASFLYEYKDQEFVKHFILVSGVSENLGKGVVVQTGVAMLGIEQEDLFMDVLRGAVYSELVALGMDSTQAVELANGVERSKMGHQREFISFMETNEEVETESNGETTSFSSFGAGRKFKNPGGVSLEGIQPEALSGGSSKINLNPNAVVNLGKESSGLKIKKIELGKIESLEVLEATLR